MANSELAKLSMVNDVLNEDVPAEDLILNIDDLERAGSKKLSRHARDYFNSGATDQVTYARPQYRLIQVNQSLQVSKVSHEPNSVCEIPASTSSPSRRFRMRYLSQSDGKNDPLPGVHQSKYESDLEPYCEAALTDTIVCQPHSTNSPTRTASWPRPAPPPLLGSPWG